MLWGVKGGKFSVQPAVSRATLHAKFPSKFSYFHVLLCGAGTHIRGRKLHGHPDFGFCPFAKPVVVLCVRS